MQNYDILPISPNFYLSFLRRVIVIVIVFRYRLSFFVTKEQPAVGQEAVEHEELVAHAVSGVTADGGADDETKYWGCYADNGCIAALPVAVEQGEGEKSQQRTVGVSDEGVDDVDEGICLAEAEDKDTQGKEQRHNEVRRLAQAFVVGSLADVNAEGGGEGSQRTVNSRERCGQYAEKEDDRNVLQGISYEQVVGIGGQGRALLTVEHYEHGTQQQEQRIDGQESYAVGTHIFLRIAETLAGEVLLHHVLVEARHDDDDKGSRNEGEHKADRPCMPYMPYMAHKPDVPYMPYKAYMPYYDYQRSEHAERLQGVGPYQRLDAAAAGV